MDFEKHRVFGKENGDQQLRDLEFAWQKGSLGGSKSHPPSLWFIVEEPLAQPHRTTFFWPWTAKLHDHRILGYLGVYVDDLLIAGKRTLNDTVYEALQQIWKTTTPEHLAEQQV